MQERLIAVKGEEGKEDEAGRAFRWKQRSSSCGSREEGEVG